MGNFQAVRFRIERELEHEGRTAELSVDEIKRKLIRDWGYGQGLKLESQEDDNDV